MQSDSGFAPNKMSQSPPNTANSKARAVHRRPLTRWPLARLAQCAGALALLVLTPISATVAAASAAKGPATGANHYPSSADGCGPGWHGQRRVRQPYVDPPARRWRLRLPGHRSSHPQSADRPRWRILLRFAARRGLQTHRAQDWFPTSGSFGHPHHRNCVPST